MQHTNFVNEHFASLSNRRHYFLDFKRTVNNSHYIQITRSDAQLGGGYLRSSVVVFEEDFEFLIQAFSSLFHAAAYHQAGEVQVHELNRQAQAESGIKGWPVQLRPREKMLEHGPSFMSDAELIAMLIGSGSKNESAVALAERMLAEVGGDVGELNRLSIPQLCRFSGMGIAKACAVKAGMELGRRVFNV
ncbi:UPF0758 domain-containing protein [Olivibacter sp. XZL3]|uniref:UPF0758 domain-containing protein n=1 Tax=Olivibacter sp. XZL3 TaxID=1735116 RepID=UPI001064E97A|nr:UPF0758 domain-containing protein [Olivibacter sp. XZL3]